MAASGSYCGTWGSLVKKTISCILPQCVRSSARSSACVSEPEFLTAELQPRDPGTRISRMTTRGAMNRVFVLRPGAVEHTLSRKGRSYVEADYSFDTCYLCAHFQHARWRKQRFE